MEKKYLNFPVAQIPYILTDRETALAAVISYAVVSYARKENIPIEAAGDFLDIEVCPGVKERAAQCHDGTKSMTSIEKDTAFEFRDGRMSDFETLCLVANLACRSIVGKHPYCLCRKNLIFSRMSGGDSIIPPSDYMPDVRKLDGDKGRRRWERVRNVLIAKYGLSVYAPLGTRGMYISYALSPEELATSVETKKMKRKSQKTSAQLKAEALSRLEKSQNVCTP